MATSKRITLTGNVAAQQVLTTDVDDSGISLQVVAGGSLGGGTLTLLRKPLNDSGDPVLLDTLAVGDASRYDAGGGVQYYLTLTGATAPSLTIIVSGVR